MKEGWTYKKLGEICRIERGGSPRPIKAFITNDTNGLNWIKIGDTDPQGKYIYSTKEKIRPEGLKKSRWVEENEFLLSNSMSFGRPYVLKTNGCIHDGWLVLRDYQESLNTDFFYYLLISPTVQRQFKTKAQGSTVSNLNTDRVAGVNVLFPTIEKQLSIVARLDAAFAHIDSLKANAEKQLAEARQLFQAELTECMRPKEGWEEKIFGDNCEVTDYVANGSFATLRENVKYYNEPNYAILVRLADYSSDFDKDKFVYVDKHAYHFLSKSSLKPGDIIMSNVGSIGKCFICPDLGQPMTIGPNSVLIKTPNNPFYLHYFRSGLFMDKLLKITNQATLSKFNKTQLRNMKVVVPPLSVQQSIVSRLDALSANIKKLEEVQRKTLAECDALKQAMLREVFE